MKKIFLALSAITFLAGAAAANAAPVDPYTLGSKMGAFDPFTDGARSVQSPRDVFTDGSRARDPFLEGARSRDPYLDGGHSQQRVEPNM